MCSSRRSSNGNIATCRRASPPRWSTRVATSSCYVQIAAPCPARPHEVSSSSFESGFASHASVRTSLKHCSPASAFRWSPAARQQEAHRRHPVAGDATAERLPRRRDPQSHLPRDVGFRKRSGHVPGNQTKRQHQGRAAGRCRCRGSHRPEAEGSRRYRGQRADGAGTGASTSRHRAKKSVIPAVSEAAAAVSQNRARGAVHVLGAAERG